MGDPLDVNSRDDLAPFVEDLLANLQSSPEQWENQTLERYLDTLARFLRDLPG